MTNFSLKPGVDNYAVMGHPVAHSKSPRIHIAFAGQTRQTLHYQAIEVAYGGFNEALTEFQGLGGMGLNVTVPFKRDAQAASDQLTERARRAHAVNTLWFDKDGRRCGDTTDGIGLVRDLTANLGINLHGGRILILGAGGAVRGVLDPLFDAGSGYIVIANRTVENAVKLAGMFSDRGEILACSYANLPAMQFHLVINGTSASLQGQVPPLPDTVLKANTICYDMMYADVATPFVQWARDRAAGAVYDGLGMLVEQAAVSFEIWRSIRPETKPVIEMLRKQG
ncbi:MAG: shikimate dehydrogenase [Gammaproteobacteria bacterium RBG_16_51_14]|nr:MAG: shikimate dehydrogenase [Gammaproteobacteria bacterium RBG_16_51_14]